MDKIIEVFNWCVGNPSILLGGYLAVVGIASWIVKLTPTLKDDSILKSIVGFVGKYIAINRVTEAKAVVKKEVIAKVKEILTSKGIDVDVDAGVAKLVDKVIDKTDSL